MLEVTGGRRDLFKGLMNTEQTKIFKHTIKQQIKKEFTSQEVAQIMIIFDVLITARRKLAASASAARYSFDFGIRAMEKHQQITAAITLLERLIKK